MAPVRPLAAALLSLAGCGAVEAPAPSAPLPEAPPPACAAADLVDRAIADADRLAATGAVDEPLLVLEGALKKCPADRRLEEKRRALEASLGGPGAWLGRSVEEGWAKAEAGDAEGARRAFSRAVRASVASGAAPRALPLAASSHRDPLGHVWTAARLDERTLLLAASTPDETGAVVMRYRRAGALVTAHPLRFAARRGSELQIAGGAAGRFAVVYPTTTLLYPGPTAPAIELPGGSTLAFGDHGAALVVARDGGVETFDAATGVQRGARQAIAMPSAGELVADPAHPWVTRCKDVSSTAPSDAFVLDVRTGALLARAPGAKECRFDPDRGRLVSIHLEPGAGARFRVMVDLTPIDGSATRTVDLGAAGGSAPSLFVSPTSGEVEVTVSTVDPDKSEVRSVPGTRAAPVPAPVRAEPRERAPAVDRLSTIPFGTAEDVDLAPLRSLARRPREILPNHHSRGFIAFTANGARSPDGRWIAVVDHDPAADPPDEDLLLADAAKLVVRHRVHLAHESHDWLQVEFLDDRFVTVQIRSKTYVVHVASGTLRAILHVDSRSGGTLLGDDLLAEGGAVVDLSQPRTLEDGAAAYVALPLSTRSQAHAPEGGPAPAWLHCALGDWVVPFEACAHRLLEGSRR